MKELVEERQFFVTKVAKLERDATEHNHTQRPSSSAATRHNPLDAFPDQRPSLSSVGHKSRRSSLTAGTTGPFDTTAALPAMLSVIPRMFINPPDRSEQGS